MGKRGRIRQQRIHISRRRWTLFIAGTCCFAVATGAVLLGNENIIPAIWSYLLTSVTALCGLLLGLGAWLFPLSPVQAEAPILPYAAELVRASFRLGDDIAANFPYVIQPVQDAYTAVQRTLLDASRDTTGARGGVVILGEANAGKTRLAFEALTQTLPNWLVLRWRPDYSIDKMPTAAIQHKQGLVIFIEDLQDYVPAQTMDTDGNALTTDPRITTLHTLLETLRQDVRHMVVVATCRLEDEVRVRAGLGELFTNFGVVELRRFSMDAHAPDAAEVIAIFQMHGSTHISDWDGTLGSLVLGLSTKNQEYLKIRATPAATVLRAMKLLTHANILEHTERRLRNVCAAVFGEEALQANEKTWQEAVKQLVQKQFVREVVDESNLETALVIRKDTYFEQVVSDYPQQHRPQQVMLDLVKLHKILEELKDVQALLNLGIKYSNQKKYEQAKSVLASALKFDATLLPGWLYMGALHLILGKNEEALKANKEAISLDGSNELAYYNKGVALFQLHRYNEALKAFDRALYLNPRLTFARVSQAKTFVALNKDSKALDILDTALASEALIDNKSRIAILMEKAEVLSRLERYRDELVLYQEVLDIDPSSSLAAFLKAATLKKLKEYKQALLAYNYALQLNPEDIDALNNKALVFKEMGHFEEAQQCIGDALNRDPHNGELWDSKGEIHLAQKQYQDALKAFKHAVQYSPENERFRRNATTAFQQVVVVCRI